jgi:hypothetical protein
MVIVPFKLKMEKCTNLSLNYNVRTTIELPNSGFPTTNLMNFTERPQESSSRLHQIPTRNFDFKGLNTNTFRAHQISARLKNNEKLYHNISR